MYVLSAVVDGPSTIALIDFDRRVGISIQICDLDEVRLLLKFSMILRRRRCKPFSRRCLTVRSGLAMIRMGIQM